jgi:translation initiation factor 2B subunit (eIF-2B alpha/beta/delta family)
MGEGLIPEETKKKQTIQQLITQMLTEEKLSQSESKLIS